MRKGFKVFALLTALILLVSCDTFKAEEMSKAAQMYGNKTQFVGDNSKVGGIIDGLNISDTGAKYTFELKTDAEPYEVLVEYSGGENLSKEEFENSAIYCASIMFCLIDNVDNIIFKNEEYSREISREDIDEKFNMDVREYNKSLEDFETFYYGL